MSEGFVVGFNSGHVGINCSGSGSMPLYIPDPEGYSLTVKVDNTIGLPVKYNSFVGFTVGYPPSNRQLKRYKRRVRSLKSRANKTKRKGYVIKPKGIKWLFDGELQTQADGQCTVKVLSEVTEVIK